MKADTPLVGQVVGSYEILRELGRGGMGVVYKAHETSLNRMVALKVLPAYLATDQAFLSRFVREARAAASLIHPNVVTIHAVGEDHGTHFIAMEYVKGQTVSQLIRQSGTIHPERALQITLAAADALSEAHKRGIVHRDIKPQNIMIDEAGRVKVMDFGLAKAVTSESNLTADGAMIGTPMYMSPEQCEGKKADPRSDIYALGVVLYEMLSGRTPYEAATPLAVMRQIVDRPFPDIQQVSPVVSADTARVLRLMVAKDVADRYQSIDQAREDIRAVLKKSGAVGAVYTDKTVPVEMAETYAPDRGVSQVDTVMPVAAPAPAPPGPAPAFTPAPAGSKSSALVGIVAAVITAALMLGGFLLIQNRDSSTPPAQSAAIIPASVVESDAAPVATDPTPSQEEVDRSAAEAAAAAAQAEEARKRAEEQALMLAAAEEAARREAEAQASATAEEAEQHRLAAEAALAKLEEERAAREQLEREAERLKAAEEEARAKAAEMERQKREAEQMAAARTADQEAARRAADQEAARKAAEARRAAEEEAARVAAEEEAARKAAEEEAARLAAAEAAKPQFPDIAGSWSASGERPSAEGRGGSIDSSASITLNGNSANIRIDGKELTGQYVGGQLTGKYETTISAIGRSGKGKTQVPQVWEVSLLAVGDKRLEGTFSVTHSGFQASEASKNGTRQQSVVLTR